MPSSQANPSALPVISAGHARRVLLNRQQLGHNPGGRINRLHLLETIRALGFVQVDSVNTVARAHHMILFARHQGYRPRMLDQLLEKDRHLFENWTHDASVIPSEFYPYWRCKFQRLAPRLKERWLGYGREGFEDRFTPILEHIEQHGALRARDLAPEGKGQEPGWWNWHPDKTALEYLWRTGQLAVCHRKGFEKSYDLSARVIPDPHHSAEIDEQAFIDWCCRSAMERLGIATSGEIAAFWDLISPKEAQIWCADTGRHDLVPVLVEAVDGSRPRKAFALPDVIDIVPDDLPARLRILSPFDPVLRDRKRANRLFGFDYRIEIFVPEAQRKYGYYVFPMMEGERMVGRIDMKRQAPGGPLHVQGLWWEKGIRGGKGRLARLDSALDRMCRFSGCSEVTWEPGLRT